MIEVSLKLPEAMLAALKKVAVAQDASVGQIVREAITRDLYRRERAKTTDRSDERLVAPLRALLADDLNYARSWAELQTRLRRKGYDVREAGGGIILVAFPSGRRLCKGSELGHAYAALCRRFGAPFPAAHPTLRGSATPAPAQAPPLSRAPPPPPPGPARPSVPPGGRAPRRGTG